MASDSVEENNPLFIQGKCVNGCEATLAVGPEKTQLYVCMEEMAKLSEYFRVMFFGDFKEKKLKQFEITDETPEDMVCFFNSINLDPDIREIYDDSIELLMRLSNKFQCDVLKECLKHHIEVNEPNSKSASTVSNWFIWSRQYNMPEQLVNVCVNVLKIDDDSIELLMSLADECQSDMLKKRLKQYIEVNVPGNMLFNGSTLVSWLVWSKQFNMPEEIVIACLDVQAINHTTMESLMRLADEYQCDVLKKHLKQYIECNEPLNNPSTILNWLVLSLQYHMPEQFVEICLPGVACLPLSFLNDNREKIGFELFSKLLYVKMQLTFKATELYKKKIVESCSHCGWKHSSRELIKIIWCEVHDDGYHIFCSVCCLHKYDHNLPKCCDKQDFYYKCSRCQIDPSLYKNKDQCVCVRKNYELELLLC